MRRLRDSPSPPCTQFAITDAVTPHNDASKQTPTKAKICCWYSSYKIRHIASDVKPEIVGVPISVLIVFQDISTTRSETNNVARLQKNASRKTQIKTTIGFDVWTSEIGGIFSRPLSYWTLFRTPSQFVEKLWLRTYATTAVKVATVFTSKKIACLAMRFKNVSYLVWQPFGKVVSGHAKPCDGKIKCSSG